MSATWGLSVSDLELIRSVFEDEPHIDCVVLYGSRALGTFKNGSDIDLALYGARLNFDDLVRIKARLDDLSIPYQFDITLMNQPLPSSLVEHIEIHGKKFFSRIA